MAKTRMLTPWEELTIEECLKKAIDRGEIHLDHGKHLLNAIERSQSIRLYFPEPVPQGKRK